MIEIKFSDELGMFVLIDDGKVMMKNKLRSTLLKKYAKYLQGQGQ